MIGVGGGRMKRPSPEEFGRAVALARAAIQAQKARPISQPARSPHAVAEAIKVRQAKGEAPSAAELGAVLAELAEHERRKQRRRGRPEGTRNHAALRALRAAIRAVQESGLRPYRNNATGHGLTQCDAIAKAMTAEGFRTMNGYDAAAREMKAQRRNMKGSRGPFGDLVRQMRDMQRNFAQAFEPVARQLQELGRTWAALGEIKLSFGGVKLPPETLDALNKATKTKR